jgi:hypothetical protein
MATGSGMNGVYFSKGIGFGVALGGGIDVSWWSAARKRKNLLSRSGAGGSASASVAPA